MSIFLLAPYSFRNLSPYYIFFCSEMKVQSGFKEVFSPELDCDVVTPDHNSTPILCSHLSFSSKKEDNLYNTPGHAGPTYQAIFTPEMG